MTGRAALAAWYWLLLPLWASAFAGAWLGVGWTGLGYLLTDLADARPLAGLMVQLAALAPLIALPFALRRDAPFTE